MNTRMILEKVFGDEFPHREAIAQAYQKAIDEMMSQRDPDRVKLQLDFLPSQVYNNVFKAEMIAIFGEGAHQVGKKEILLKRGHIDQMAELSDLMRAYFINPELDTWVEKLKATQQEKGYKPGWVWYQIKNKHGAFVANVLA